MITMKKVADHANVSRITVSRVLSGHPSVSDETREKVLYWVKKLDYKPNVVAQSLARNKTNTLGIMIPSIKNLFYAELIEAIEEQAIKKGYSIILNCSRRDEDKEKEIVNSFISRKVDGIISIPAGKEIEGYFPELNIPLVTIGKKRLNHSCIFSSFEKVCDDIVEHLVDMGHSKIGYVGPTRDKKEISLGKYTSFIKGLELRGLELSDMIESTIDYDTGKDNAYEQIIEYVSKTSLKSTALFVHNDVAACGTLNALLDLGYEVPKDIALVSFDNTVLSTLTRPKISSVAQPIREIGVTAINQLLKEIDQVGKEKIDIELHNDLVIRESSMSK